MARLAALIVLATPTLVVVAQEVSLRGAQVKPTEGTRGGVQRRLVEADEYEDCFADKEQRVMTDVLVDDRMTPALCRSHCEDNGAKYYATQYRNQCYCGYSDVASDYEIYGSATCDFPCAGDDSVPCGGAWAFSLYKFTTVDDDGASPPVSAEPASGYGGGRYGERQRGYGTYYGETTDGNCAFGANPPRMYRGMIPVALNRPEYRDSLMCGACLEGTANGDGAGADPIPRTFKGVVTDQCPECSEGDLDFSMSGDGRWDIEWEFVTCPGEELSFKFEGSNSYFWKLQPQGTKTPVKSLTINGKTAARTQDNHFELENSGDPWDGPQTIVTTTMAGEIQTSEACP